MKRYLAFDLETAKLMPADVRDVLKYRPLGISCAAATANDLPEPLLWYGGNDRQHPASQMTREEAGQLVSELTALTEKGYTLITWSGADFDFDILAEESGMQKECAQLAVNHIDMLFHVLCSLGHRVSLQKAAEGMNIQGKKAGITGALTPTMWADGKYEEVLEYCAQDARLTLKLAEACERVQYLHMDYTTGIYRPDATAIRLVDG